eukprot:Mrub_01567.p1 GENE.Mrub_01567~~Mrub_01567.p1  ORF type:complete len:670 (-),score=215.85 Mrub_01567:86-2023(-)
MQQTLDGSIKSITSGSKLSILQESKEKLNKRIDEYLKDIEEKDKKIKKLEIDIEHLQNDFRGNQNVRGTLFGINEINEYDKQNNATCNRLDIESLPDGKKQEYKKLKKEEEELIAAIAESDKFIEAGENVTDAIVEDNYALKEKLYKDINPKLKRFKTNNSKLQQHELQLFELKEVEKESNKYLYLYNRIFDQNQELRTNINEVRKEIIYYKGQKEMLTGVKSDIFEQIEIIKQDVEAAKDQKAELAAKIKEIKRNIRENQAALEKDYRKYREMREQGFKAQDGQQEKRKTTNRIVNGKTVGKFAPLDGDHDSQHIRELRGTHLNKLRKSTNSLNKIHDLVKKDKEEDFVLGVDKSVEDDIKDKRKQYEDFKVKSQSYQKELKNVENEARTTKQEKDKLRNQFKELYKQTNNDGRDDQRDEAKKLEQLKQQLTDINENNYSLFVQSKDIKEENNMHDKNKEIEESDLNNKTIKKQKEGLMLKDKIDDINLNIENLVVKKEKRESHKRELKLMYADAISTIRNMIKYMNIQVDSKSQDIMGNEGEINHENILMYLSKIEDKVTELVIRRNRQTKQDPNEVNKDDMSDINDKIPQSLQVAKDMTSKIERDEEPKENNLMLKKSEMVNRAIAKFATTIDTGKFESLKK